MSTELRVLVAHLGELAAKQREAAAVIASATDAVHGTGASVAATHGAISSSTAAAGEAEDARRAAGGQVQRETRKMQQRLAESAQRYTVTDQMLGGALGIEM